MIVPVGLHAPARDAVSLTVPPGIDDDPTVTAPGDGFVASGMEGGMNVSYNRLEDLVRSQAG